VKTIPTAAVAVLVAASAAAVSSLSPAVASPALTRPAIVTALSPQVTVQPSQGLSTSSTVHLAAAGLPAITSVDLIECDRPTTIFNDGVEGCPVLSSPTTATDGTMSIDLNPRDLVFRSEPLGDPVPVYCRADDCRYYVEWTDGKGRHSIHTRKMQFTGSPATISATPASGLVDGERVRVNGSAKGSSGRYVTIVEESCYAIIQGSGCDGALPLATFKLTATDTYSGSVRLFRFLGDGEDCRDALFGCQLSVTVLDDRGLPDDSFGVSRLGRPAVELTFGS
jgi:hypothetical protein